MAIRYFISGTDTEVGKTWVTALLALHYLQQGARVAVYKPVQTGVTTDDEYDTSWVYAHVAQWLTSLDEADRIQQLQVKTGFAYKAPAAPSVADTEQTFDEQAVLKQANALAGEVDVLLVEGAGGVFVPLNQKRLLTSDLIRHLGMSTLVVACPNLGTINHTLLSVEALRNQGCSVAGVLVHESQPLTSVQRASVAVQTVMQELGRHLNAPLLGSLPFEADAQQLTAWPYRCLSELEPFVA